MLRPLLLAAALVALAAPAMAADTVYRNVTLIDGTGAKY